VFEREYLCKNSRKNNYREGCRSHEHLKLHYTLFCFFSCPLYMGRFVEIGAFVGF
jgi:hypothetical protein